MMQASITTSATGINIGGAIDAVTSITGSGDIAIATDKFTLDATNGNAVFGGNITAATGTTFSSWFVSCCQVRCW